MANIKLFGQSKVRSSWNEEEQKWYFSIVDVIGILTESPNPRKYWSVLKTRLKKEGSELTTVCSQLKMNAGEINTLLAAVRFKQGKLLGYMEHLGFDLKAEAVLQYISRHRIVSYCR